MKYTTPFLKEKVAKKKKEKKEEEEERKKIKTFGSIQAMFTWVKMSPISD